MEILDYNRFINEKLVKQDSSANTGWNTQLIGMINYDLNPLSQNNILGNPNMQKRYFENVQKQAITWLTDCIKKCNGYRNNTVMSSKKVGNAMNIFKIMTDFNLYEADKGGKYTQDLINTINKKIPNIKGVSSIEFAIVSFGKNEKQMEIPVSYNKVKKEWAETKLTINTREMK